MGAASGGKGQQPPPMGGGAGPAMNMAAGTGGGFGSQMLANPANPTASDARMGYLQQLYNRNPAEAYAYTQAGPNLQWYQQNQNAAHAALGLDDEARKHWINDSEYGNEYQAIKNDPSRYQSIMSGFNPGAAAPAAPGAAAPAAPGAAAPVPGVPGAPATPGAPAAAPAAPGAPVATPSPAAGGIRNVYNPKITGPAMQFPGQGGYMGDSSNPGNNQGLIGALMGGGGPRTRPWEFGGGSQQSPWGNVGSPEDYARLKKDPNNQIDFSQLGAMNNGFTTGQGLRDFGTAGGQRGAAWEGTEQPGLTPGAGPIPQAGANNPIADMLYRQNRGNMDMRRGNPKGAAPPSMYGPGSSAQARGGKGMGLPGMQPTTM